MKFQFTLRTLLLLTTLLGSWLGLFLWQQRLVNERRAAIRLLLQKTKPTRGYLQAISGDRYRCADMVKVVNLLRASGKHEALSTLRQFYMEANYRDSQIIILVCRCLFQNPAGWKIPALGGPQPMISVPFDEDRAAFKDFPAFPITFSHDVPFLLVAGYRLGGMAEDAGVTLYESNSLALIPADLPTTGFEAAARSLIEEPRFLRAYPDKDTRERMVEMVLKQAEEN